MEIVSRSEAIASGLKHYFTGKPCPNGHVDVRFVSSYVCKRCAVEHHARYRQTEDFASREAAYKAAYRKANRSKAAAYTRWYWLNHPNAKAQNKASKDRNKLAINLRQRIENLTPEQAEKLTQHRRRMYLKFRDDRLARAKAGRGIRKNAEGSFTATDITKIFCRQKGKCADCKSPLSAGKHLDHIMPLALGGSNWPSNLQYLCPRCNLSKKDKHPVDWARERGRLL